MRDLRTHLYKDAFLTQEEAKRALEMLNESK
ncbi:MAG: hypothetical protein JWR54_617 [Mucilaginibacter sp.]|jgi:hypothetical protein|nr:hypothetical protein [Mucilaginibacter sp.]